MNSIFGKAFLAAAIGLGSLIAIPATATTASADEIVIVRDGWHHGWRDRYERRYERPRYERFDGPRYGYYARPWHRHHHMRCWENRWGRLICER
ncbi:hypothetical protein SAMN05421890_3269 [Ensifer adhaerens]|nr:hypothetical protein SAMN05421890_3269 [Ensifer adhaerens]HZG28305.1 hypothetical protein [Ensifer sp.]